MFLKFLRLKNKVETKRKYINKKNILIKINKITIKFTTVFINFKVCNRIVTDLFLKALGLIDVNIDNFDVAEFQMYEVKK